MGELKLHSYCVFAVSFLTLIAVTRSFQFLPSNQEQSNLVNKNSCDNSTEFKCASFNKCIKKYQVCDGFKDCEDKSDENHCKCKKKFF